MTKSKDVIRETGRVSIVFFNFQIGFVIKQPVKHVGGIAYGRVDHLGVERRVLIGNMSIEKHAGFNAITKINLPRLLTATACPEPLPVRRRSCAFSPMD